jgi:rRNA maturation RNase YbeY
LVCFQELIPGQRPEPNDEGEKDLGHIVLGMGYLKNASASHDMSLEDYLPTVISHGMIHLLGYDHQTDAQYNQMMAKERRTMRRLKELNMAEPPPKDEEPMTGLFTWTESRHLLQGKKNK